MAQFHSYFPVELRDRGPTRAQLPEMFSTDDKSNVIGARVTDGGEAVTLTGSVTGIILRSNGTRHTTPGNIIQGNLAYIALSAAALSVPGNITVFVNITEGGRTTTLLECHGNIRGIG